METQTVWYKSKSNWSAIITVLSLLSYLFGLGPLLSGTDIASYVELILAVVSALGAGVGKYIAAKQTSTAE